MKKEKEPDLSEKTIIILMVAIVFVLVLSAIALENEFVSDNKATHKKGKPYAIVKPLPSEEIRARRTLTPIGN